MLSLVSHHHGVPFFIAAPTTTLDATKPDGSHIEIEQRPPEELTHFRGQRVVTEKIEVSIWVCKGVLHFRCIRNGTVQER
jgi:methylthioribose-1-phosphate isomerase